MAGMGKAGAWQRPVAMAGWDVIAGQDEDGGPVSRAHARTHTPTFHLHWSEARLQIFFPIFTGQKAIFTS